MIFFKPPENFVDWLVSYANSRIIVDVGCGREIHLLRCLIDRGVMCLGIEPDYDPIYFRSTYINNIIPFNGEDCKWLWECTKNALILFCRPCHSGFVERVIKCIDPSNEILYISKPENVELDLPGYKVEELKTPELECERVYKVIR